MNFSLKQPKTVHLSAYIEQAGPFTVNVHDGKELVSINNVKTILDRATPEQLEILASLFSKPAKLNQAMSFAKAYL